MKQNTTGDEITVAKAYATDKTLPSFALITNAIGVSDSFDFWQIIQSDLQRKNLAVNYASLTEIHTNNLLLKETLSFTQESTSYLNSLNNQLEQLNTIISRQAETEEIENFAKELIYNIKKIDIKLASNNDNMFVSFEANMLLFLLANNGISTSSFRQISDKEYFEEVVDSLKAKVKNLLTNEKKDLESFLSIYKYCSILIEDYKKKKHSKTVNVPDNFASPQKPERDPILDCEEELEYEFSNCTNVLGSFSYNIKKYIPNTDELPSFFEKFYKAKKEYDIAELKYSVYKELSEVVENQTEHAELTEKITYCISLIDTFLEQHPEFSTDFPRLTINMEYELIDYVEVTKSYETMLEQKNKNLQNYYSEMKNKLENRILSQPPVSQQEKNHKPLLGFLSKFKKH